MLDSIRFILEIFTGCFSQTDFLRSYLINNFKEIFEAMLD